ncbi:uncharacterized protein LOC132045979 [Lycium ferocissimum]|uniref:uncharacterized protein LOC132045979 n=1 Tax=Lycium ferocissimum TaxID=112874 RepID=UPI0028154DD7|nr:uncharacterized protein LOC132045979 [Lycium ferocissimum]
MDITDKSWMDLRRSTNEYMHGVNDFLDYAFERASQGNEILCPCKICFNRYWHDREGVEGHLVGYGFARGYTKWVFLGEGFSARNTPHLTNDVETSYMHDDIDGLLHDTFRNVEGDLRHGVREGPSEDAKRFFKLVEEGKQELYLGCKNFSKLSFTIRLYLFKCIHGLSNVTFSDLLDLIKEAFPFAQIPESFNKAKKVIKDLGLGYEKIHACPNDCMLFWNDNAKMDNCSVWGSSRWKNVRDDLTNKNTKIPAKVLRYFPLKPRIRRIYVFSNISSYEMACSERPMKMLKRNLTGNGEVETYDVETNQTFIMRAALLWTVSDFPALAMLSGWSTKGRWACPTCNYDTFSQYLKHSRKMCYLGHQTFLPPDHPFRRDKKSFNGKEEHKAAPTPLSGIEVLEELREFNNVFGKGQKKRSRKNDGPWKKRSILFELPYWAHNKSRAHLT